MRIILLPLFAAVCLCTVIAFIHAQDATTTGAIYGFVLSTQQEVVGGAQVEVVSGPSRVGTRVTSRGPDSVMYDGGFFIPRLLPGVYTIEVSHKKYMNRTLKDLKVEVGGGTFVTAELQPKEDIAGIISGSVTVRSVSVKGLVVGYAEEGAKKPVETVTLEEDGRFSFGDVMPGTYVVTVTKEREEVHRSEPVTVEKKKHKRLRPIRISPEALLEKPGWITGKVLGPDRKPVYGASITTTKMPPEQKKVSVRSDKDGKFEMKNLRPGSYELQASKSRVGEDTTRAHVRSNRGKSVTLYLKEK